MELTQEVVQFECKDAAMLGRIVNRAIESGYKPIISQAIVQYVVAFGGNISLEVVYDIMTQANRQGYLKTPSSHQSPYVVPRMSNVIFSSSGQKVPSIVAGELFFTPKNAGLIYVRVMQIERTQIAQSSVSSWYEMYLETGYIGDATEAESFEVFKVCVADTLSTVRKRVRGNVNPATHPRFVELVSSSKESFAATRQITSVEMAAASVLEKRDVKEFAIQLRRSEGLETPDVHVTIEALYENGLAKQEYSIRCRKTKKLLTKVPSIEGIGTQIIAMTCPHCGSSFTNEAITAVYTGTELLSMLLDKSYWMSVSLVRILRQIAVPDNNVLLNVQDGPEEVDAFVEINGTLILFELKDSTFSLGHAYPLAARIAINKPDYVVIISTNGVAPEVKEHFKRVAPTIEPFGGSKNTTYVYVEEVSDMYAIIKNMVTRIRVQKIRKILSDIEGLTAIQVSLKETVGKVIGL